MGRKAYDGVYSGDDKIYWAYHKGKKKTPNTRRAADLLYTEMVAEAERAAIARDDEDAPHLQGQEVIVLRGVPGCGKSTWAKEWMVEHYWYKRISRDSMREMFNFGEYSTWNEKFIRKMRRTLIRECLREGAHLIIDDTNLTDRDMRDIRDSAHVYSHVIGVERTVYVPIRIIDFNTPLEECIRRDALRPKPVGADRITVMWYGFYRFDFDEQVAAYKAAKRRLEAAED